MAALLDWQIGLGGLWQWASLLEHLNLDNAQRHFCSIFQILCIYAQRHATLVAGWLAGLTV